MPAIPFTVLFACLIFSPQQNATQVSSTSAPAQGSGNFIVAGTVTNATSGAPIPQAEVTLAPQFRGPETQTITTNASGNFAFAGVAGGRYTLSARRRGFTQQSYLQHGPYFSAVLVGPEFDTSNLSLQLPQTSVITGHIYDQFAEPVRHAQVVVVMREEAAPSGYSPRGNAQTDDEGRYRVAHLQPGTYFVAVATQPWYARHPLTIQPAPQLLPAARRTQGTVGFSTRTQAVLVPPDPLLDVVYERTFFGGATDISGAQAISLAAGDTQSADITLTPVPARHVRLNLGEESNQYPNISPRNEFGAFPIGPQIQAIPVGQGVWELVGVPPGPMSATLRIFDSQNPAQQRVENLELGLEGEASVSPPPSMVTVRGRLTGEAGFEPANSSILLSSVTREGQSNAQVGADGAFEFREKFAPGSYILVVNGGNIVHYLTSLTATGARVSGRHVEIGSQDVNMALTVSGSFAQYSGFVSREGKHTAGMLVVLLPSDAATRDISMIRCDQSDADGSFAIRNVLPGKYSLFALENAWDKPWNRADFLAQFAAKGEAIRAIPGDKKTIDLTAVDAKTASPASPNH